MQNFNGQLKKRTVNLGGGFKNNRTNILLHTQKEREKRERERAREKSVIIVQSFIRRHLAIIQYKKHVALQWESLIGSNEINYIISQFSIFYDTVYNMNERKLEHITILNDILTTGSLKTLHTSSILGLLITLTKTINQININDSTDLQVLEKIIEVTNKLHPFIKQGEKHIGIVNAFSILVSKFIGQRNFQDAAQLLPLITKYSPLEIDDYVKFLTTPNLTKVSSEFKIPFDILNEHIKDSSPFSTLNNDEKLTLLSSLVSQATSFDVKEISPISWVLSSLHVIITTKSEDEFSSKIDDDVDEDQKSGLQRKFIDEDLNAKIEKLYNREFITAVTKNVHDSHTLTRLYGSLIRLKPTLKSTFIIYLIPDSFQDIVNSVIDHPVFRKFVELKDDTIYNIKGSFIDEIFNENVNFVQYDLYIFLEVFQYYLIVSNDFEIFKKYDFTTEKYRKIALFLKNFTLVLFWNLSKVNKRAKEHNWGFLETLCIKVLNQVYLKDSRLSIVNKNLWLISDKKVEIFSLVELITLYEDHNDANDSDDEENKIIYSLKSDKQAYLKIFLHTPFFISFQKRVEIFQLLVELNRDKLGLSENNNFFSMFRSKQRVNVRRGHLLEDAYENFNKQGDTFKGPLDVNFTNEHGEVERGIDGGGLTKEFLTSTVKEGFQGLFVENDSHELYPNPQIGLKYQYRIDSEEQLKSLNYINFLGKIIGKCLYDRILVDINFSPFFLTKFNTGYKNSFDDLRSLDNELYANLIKLLGMDDEELAAMNLTFSVDEQINGKNISIDLIPNGSIIPVNKSNKLKFVHEVSNFKLNKLINIQCNSFLNGLFEMISKDWLSMFNPYELQMLISGEKDVNVDDLRDNVVYNGFTTDDDTIKYFWEVVEEMSSKDRFQLVKFVTSVPRAPLLGFKALYPKFGIAQSAKYTQALPTSSTCVNLLKLPNYKNKEILKEKLLYAINSEAGFDLE